jgi:hypothetical protein
LAPILNSVVPQTPHWPVIAPMPFFIVILCWFCISRSVLHFTQYAKVVCVHLPVILPPVAINHQF